MNAMDKLNQDNLKEKEVLINPGEKEGIKKVLLILVDGMRPDSLSLCGNDFLLQLASQSLATMSAKSVIPPVTLPCHMSLFHSISPSRHGILTNTWTPQVRPIKGLVETLAEAGLSCAMFSNWEELRDISRPGYLSYSLFIAQSEQSTDKRLTQACIDYVTTDSPDFVFLYLGDVDEIGHKYGWMSMEYLKAVQCAIECIQSLHFNCSKKYTMIITADHGGHERTHGQNIDEDMLIPLILSSRSIPKGNIAKADLCDIAPTIVGFFGLEANRAWEGHDLLCT